MNLSLLFRSGAVAVGLGSLLFTAACTYEEAPPCVIEKTNIHYQKDIAPILQNNCLRCHGDGVNARLGAGYNWDDFNQFQAEAKTGLLVHVLEQKDPTYAAIYMPRGAAKLSACDIERIKAWVANGAPRD